MRLILNFGLTQLVRWHVKKEYSDILSWGNNSGGEEDNKNPYFL
jgi:hypothetical protein